jgi:hypothetical protein
MEGSGRPRLQDSGCRSVYRIPELMEERPFQTARHEVLAVHSPLLIGNGGDPRAVPGRRLVTTVAILLMPPLLLIRGDKANAEAATYLAQQDLTKR